MKLNQTEKDALKEAIKGTLLRIEAAKQHGRVPENEKERMQKYKDTLQSIKGRLNE